MAVISGAARLVPPTWSHPFSPSVSYVASPEAGSASAEMSATARIEQSGLRPAWKSGCASVAEQPDPPLSHAVSSQPRETALSFVSRVPPSAVTTGRAEGHSAMYPVSPEDATIATPEWVYEAL